MLLMDAEKERKDCLTCKHGEKTWDEEPCDGCTSGDSKWERTMRLIDADALIEAHYDYCNKHQDYDARFWTWSLELMQDAPTIEAVPREDYEELERHFINWQPVRHGRWVDATRDDPCYYCCSECGKLMDFEENYCPNCGARMDLVEIKKVELKQKVADDFDNE